MQGEKTAQKILEAIAFKEQNVTSLLSIITVPLLVAVSVKHFMGEHEAQINVTSLGIKMFLLTAVPVGLGMLLKAKAPSLVEKISRTISRIAMVLFVLIIIAALAVNRVVVFGNLAALGPALILINIGMLGLGLASSRLLRLETKDATTISLESGIQNGTLGIAVGAMIAANASDSLPPTTVASAVYGITMYFVSLPFVFWRKMAVKE